MVNKLTKVDCVILKMKQVKLSSLQAGLAAANAAALAS